MPKDEQNGKITGYSIQLEGPDTTQSIYTTLSKDMLLFSYVSEEVCDLRPSTEYSFSVSAVTVAGSGPAISVSFVTPQEGRHNSMHIVASILWWEAWYNIRTSNSTFNNFIHMHCTQLSPTLLVDLKLANIAQHQRGFHGKKVRK